MSVDRLFSIFVWPFALQAIGWKTYIINGAWDIVQFLVVAYFWIETKDLTLEQIDAKIDAAVGTSRMEVLYGDEVEMQKGPEDVKKDSVATVKQC